MAPTFASDEGQLVAINVLTHRSGFPPQLCHLLRCCFEQMIQSQGLNPLPIPPQNGVNHTNFIGAGWGVNDTMRVIHVALSPVDPRAQFRVKVRHSSYPRRPLAPSAGHFKDGRKRLG